MRKLLWLGFMVLFSCVKAPQKGTHEWVNEQYSAALLQTNDSNMRAHSIPDAPLPSAPAALKDRLKGLHVIKQCPINSNAEKTSYTTLILIAGNLEGSVYGVQVTTIKQEAAWRVERATFSVDAQGAPKRYLRNCSEDLSVEKKPLNL
jgi:hypothetical protein